MRKFSVQHLLTYLISAAVLIIAGCSSSSDSGVETGTATAQANLDVINQGPVTQSGTLFVDRFRNNMAAIDISFTQFDRDTSAYLTQQVPKTGDQCDVDLPDEQKETDPQISEILNNATSISAGEAIVISSAEGTFTTLVSQLTQQDEIGYSEFTGPTPIPTDLTVDIPGDTFPAFANIAIPAVSAVENFDYPVEDLTESVVFTWTASSNPTTRIKLAMETDRFSDDTIYIECDLEDDGSFQLSSETIAKSGMFSGGFIYNAERYATKLVRSGTSVLALSNRVSIDLPSEVIGGGTTAGTR